MVYQYFTGVYYMSKKARAIGILISVVIVLGLLAVGGASVYKMIMAKFAGSSETMSLSEYYSIDDKTGVVIYDGVLSEDYAYVKDGHPYFTLDVVTSKFNHRFFWDKENTQLIYTTPTEVIKIPAGKKYEVINGTKNPIKFPYCLYENDTVYLSIEHLADNADMKLRIENDPCRVIITCGIPMDKLDARAKRPEKLDAYLYAKTTKATPIRSGSDINQPILSEVEEGEELMIVDGGGDQEKGLIKVMTADGIRGYVNRKSLSETYYVTPKSTYKAPEYRHILMDEPVYLGWQLLYTRASEGYYREHRDLSQRIVNVFSPTWFNLIGTEGDMSSVANASYMERAHEDGNQVWACFKNDPVDGKFTTTADSLEVLRHTDIREKLIANMMAYVDEFDLDGINIDFEMLSTETGPYFVEFLRELSVQCRLKKIVLSVCNYAPEPFNAYYDLKEQGEVCDYVCIMGYDEHYAGSEESGSVSSLDWFKKAIDGTLEKVDGKQIIMGVPFYTRLWKEYKDESGKNLVYVEQTMSLPECRNFIKSKGLKKEWKESAGQYYCEYWLLKKLYSVWVEDNESLKCKAEAIRDGNLAGIAGWKLGDEETSTWKVLKDTFEGTEE